MPSLAPAASANRRAADARGTWATPGRRGLTTRGRCLLAGGIAACVCAFVLDERDLLRVGLLAALLPLVASALTAGRRTKLLANHFVTPDRLSPGNPGQVSLVITNAGTRRIRPIELLENGVPDLSGGTHCMIPSLAAGKSAATTYRLMPRRRGRFVLGPPQLRLGDPFGTWEDNRTLPLRTEVLVTPTVVPLHGIPGSAGSRSAASGRTTQQSLTGDPGVGVRQYQRGDDIRLVHWRASARYDDLVVRLTDPVSHGGATVMLDHRSAAHAGSGADSSLETAVSLAASVVLHLLAGDQHVVLYSHTGLRLAGGHDIADDVLAGLAVLDADPARTLSAAPLTGISLFIGIFGLLDDDAAALAIAARRRSRGAIALLLATDDWGGPSNRAAAAQLRTAGWRVIVVHRHADLAEAWRQACAIGTEYAAARTARR